MAFNNATYYCFLLTPEYVRTLKSFQSNSRAFRLSTFIPSVILLPFIAFGNGFVLVAILRQSSLRTPANLLISCLSFADFLVGLVFLPLYAAWTYSDYVLQSCSLSGLFSCCGWLVSSASFFTITAVSIERYVALFYPLKYLTIVSTKRVVIVIMALWLCSTVMSISSLFYLLDQVRFPFTCFVLITGLVLITVTYARIFNLVRRHHRFIIAQQTSKTNNFLQRKLAVTMAYVIGVSIICYMPLGFALVSVVIHGGFSRKSLEFFHLSELLFCISSVFNPVIYCLRNQDIRAAVVSLLRDTKVINLKKKTPPRLEIRRTKNQKTSEAAV
jgi:hypothetical protein